MDDTAESQRIDPSDPPTYTVPADIITLIISQVEDSKTLLSLCLTNHFVGYEARRKLYQELDSHPRLPEFHVKCLSSLVSNQTLPPLVRRFSLLQMTRRPRCTEERLRELIPEDEETDYTKRGILFEQLLSILLRKALPRMVNLKELSFGSPRPVGREMGDLLLDPEGGDSALFQLRMLCWNDCWNGSLIDFVKRQKGLRVLALGMVWCSSDSIIEHRMPQEICDGLTTISGDQRVVEALLPFAPGVKSVVLHVGRLKDQRGVFGPTVDLKPTGRLAKAMPQLTRLVLRNYTTRTPIFTFGLEAMSGLKVLVVDCLLDEHEAVSFFL